jgi:hypothetical protein
MPSAAAALSAAVALALNDAEADADAEALAANAALSANPAPGAPRLMPSMAWTWALRLAAKDRFIIAEAFKLSSGINDGTFALIDEIVTARLAAAFAESRAEPIALAPNAADARRLSLAVALADNDAEAFKFAAACAEADADAPIPPPADNAKAKLAAPDGSENEMGGMLSRASSLANCELQRQPMIRLR